MKSLGYKGGYSLYFFLRFEMLFSYDITRRVLLTRHRVRRDASRRDDNAFRRYKRLGPDSDTVFIRRGPSGSYFWHFPRRGLRENSASPLRILRFAHPADSAVKIVIIFSRGICRVYHDTRARRCVVTGALL